MSVMDDARAGKYSAFREFGVTVEEHAKVVAPLIAQLRADLEAEFDMTEHPRKDAVWETTCALVHSTDPVALVSKYGEVALLAQPGAYRALKHMESVIREMIVLHDKGDPESMLRVKHKMRALIGENPGYRADIDAARAVLSEAVKPAPTAPA